jgi:hypothetical protein
MALLFQKTCHLVKSLNYYSPIAVEIVCKLTKPVDFGIVLNPYLYHQIKTLRK